MRHLHLLIVMAVALTSTAWAQVMPDGGDSGEDGVSAPGGGWQPLFANEGDASANIIFEVPVTIENPPRTVRIPSGGLQKLTTPDQVIVTCRIGGPGFGTGGPPVGFPDAPELDEQSLVATKALPLATFEGGVTRAVKLAMDISDGWESALEGAGWQCGMAIWASQAAEACPGGSCALQENVGTIAYEPTPVMPSKLSVTGVVPELQ